MTPEDKEDTRLVLAAVAMHGLIASPWMRSDGPMPGPQLRVVIARCAVEQADALLAALVEPQRDKDSEADDAALRG